MKRCLPLVALLPLLAACLDFRFPAYDDEEWYGSLLPESWDAQDAPDEYEGYEYAYPESFEGSDPNACAYAEAGLPALAHSSVLAAPDFVPDGESFVSVTPLCVAPGDGGERAWRVTARVGDVLRARLASDWSGVLTVTHDGCRAGHVVACGTGQVETGLGSSDAWLFLEPAQAEGEQPRVPSAFSLEVALNHSRGYEECPAAREVHADSLEAAPLVAGGPGLCWREVAIAGDTRLSPDRFFLPCAPDSASGVFGGAPDQAVRLVGDFSDGRARRADLTLVTDGTWDAGLTLTAAPCGATLALVDCGGPASVSQAVTDLLLTPGADLYAIVDGDGNAPVGTSAGAYTLVVRVYEDQCL
jgi:hypothetical protein